MLFEKGATQIKVFNAYLAVCKGILSICKMPYTHLCFVSVYQSL